jgi:putative inorganic carbon (hco3(-)) transporter
MLLELAALCVILFADVETQVLIAAVLIVPIVIILIPLEPSIGLALMVVTTGLDFLGAVSDETSASNFKLTYFHVAILLTFVSAGSNLLLRRRTTLPSADIWAPLIAFLILYVVSLTYTPYISDAIITCFRVIMLSICIPIIMINVNRPWRIGFLVGSMIFVPLAISALTLYQLYTEGSFFAPLVIKVANAIGLPVFRSSGTFSNPNSLACFLMVGIVLSFSLFFAKNIPSLIKYVLLASAVVITLGLIASFSRGGWISTIVAGALIVVFHKKWSYFGYFVIFIIICVFIISIKIPRLWEVVFERFGTLFDAGGDASSIGRLALIKSSIWIWMDHPIFGVGLRGFPMVYPDYMDPSMPHVFTELREAHTMQTEILAETGIVGLSIAAWLFFTILLHGIKSIRAIQNDSLRCLQIGFVSLFVGFLVNFTFATDITNNICWMSIGFIYAIPLVDRYLSERSANPVPA